MPEQPGYWLGQFAPCGEACPGTRLLSARALSYAKCRAVMDCGAGASPAFVNLSSSTTTQLLAA